MKKTTITIRNNKDLKKLVKKEKEWELPEIIIEENQDVTISPEEEIDIFYPIRIYGNLKIAEGNAKIKGSSKHYVSFDIRNEGQCDISLSGINENCQISIFSTDTGVVKVQGKKNKSWVYEYDVYCKVDDRAKLFWDVKGNLKAEISHNGNSVVYITARDKVNLDILCFDESVTFASVVDHSTAKIVTHDSSVCDITTRGNSSSYIYSCNNSNIDINVNNKSSVSIEGRGYSKVTVTNNSPHARIHLNKSDDSKIFQEIQKGGLYEDSFTQTTSSCR